MRNSVMKVFSAAACMFVFNCVQGMDAEKQQSNGENKCNWMIKTSNGMQQTNQTNHISQERSDGFSQVLSQMILYNSYNKQITQELEQIESHDEKIFWINQEINKVSQQRVNLTQSNSAYDRKKELRLRTKLNILEEAEQTLFKQEYDKQINKEIEGKSYDEKVSWLNQKIDETSKEYDVGNRWSPAARQSKFFERLNVLKKILKDLTHQNYEEEINKAIAEMTYDEKVSWLNQKIDEVSKEHSQRRWTDLGFQLSDKLSILEKIRKNQVQ